MDVTLVDGVGAYAYGTKGQTGYQIKVGDKNNAKVTNYLLDSSFNHTSNATYGGHAFRLSREGSGYDDKGTASEANWKYREVTGAGENPDITRYYVAISWSMTFSYTFNQETADVGLFLNLGSSASYFTPGTVTGTHDTDAAKGFRIAFVGGGRTKVWGDLASETVTANQEVSSKNGSNYTYVSTIADPLGNYVADTDSTTCDFLSSAAKTSYSQAQDGKAANLNRKDRIGTFAYADRDTDGITTLTINCTAWYEGTDPNVVNGAAMKSVSAHMSFYARADGNAA